MRSKFNVLHIRSSLGRYGPERSITTLARYIELYGYRIYLALMLPRMNGGSLHVTLSHQYGLPPERVKITHKWDPIIIANLCAAVRKLDIQLLHTHDMRSNFTGFVVSRLTGVPLVATVHGWTGRNSVVWTLEICDKILLNHFDKVVTVARSLLPEMKYVRRDKVVTIMNAIAPEDHSWQVRSEPSRGPFAQSRVALTAGVFARLSPEKGHDYLLRAFALSRHEFPGLRLFVVGDGPLKSKLRKLATELRIGEKVVFAGFREDATRIMAGVDLVVVPSLKEACPHQLLEALFLNKAIICTDVGDIPMIAGGCRNVYIVPKGSVEALRLALADILSKKQKGESLASSGPMRVEKKLSVTRMVQEYAALYQGIPKRVNSQ